MGERELVEAVGRVADRLAAATPAWFAARPVTSRTRAEVVRSLVRQLAALGVAAGTGQPPAAVPPVLGDHALADQLRVLAAELTAASAAAEVRPEALRAVRAARAEL